MKPSRKPQTQFASAEAAPPDEAASLAISARNLSKMYALYARPRDRLKQSLWHALPRGLPGKRRKYYRDFWALKNLSFDIKKGESVGVIGRNGSGKSTLLQILAGTLAPTGGAVWINGRVAALLELGSGFDPEFTGRENVYLNGAVWGLTQKEIDNIFDDIAAFANIGQFIDQPVKLYSNGMFVRLAFAVQTFVPKDIFVVDEALAVGDTAFQRKCLASLEQFKESGGTVLLVSHDTQTIVRQCDRCLLLHQGELVVDAASKPATDLYQKLMFTSPQRVAELLAEVRRNGVEANGADTAAVSGPGGGLVQRESELADRFDPDLPQPDEIIYGNGAANIYECGMYNTAGERVNVLVVGGQYQWRYRVRFNQDVHNAHFGMMLKTVDGLDAASIASFRERTYFDFISAGSVYSVTFGLTLNLVPGDYFLNVGVGGRIGSEEIYLQRRVDTAMIRVIPRDTRDSYGIAYIAPRFSYNCEAENNTDTEL